jgi:hypothetical protein
MLRLLPLIATAALLTGCAALDDLLPEPLERFHGCSVESYTIGSERSGSLRDESCAIEGGRKIAYYEFRLSDPRRVAVRVGSNDFDTYLYLYSRDGRLIAENDDITAFLNTDSRVVEDLQAGRYIIAVRGYASDDRGRYTITSEIRR